MGSPILLEAARVVSDAAEFVVTPPAPWKGAKERGTPVQTKPSEIRGGPPGQLLSLIGARGTDAGANVPAGLAIGIAGGDVIKLAFIG